MAKGKKGARQAIQLKLSASDLLELLKGESPEVNRAGIHVVLSLQETLDQNVLEKCESALGDMLGDDFDEDEDDDVEDPADYDDDDEEDEEDEEDFVL